ncbi:hypothetical protein C5167_042892 [Papaver somniferum]|uniref:Uncharacterized protein n=1 Tax=Papaver somniferum TaxID=3469 RepID=A0A4Y7L554_PAPSO|nr:hypothetical protein C5167_042892 [Papaver somniferum]
MMCMYRNALQFHGTVIASDKDVDRSETPAFNMGTVHIESKYFYAKGITFLFLEVKECEQSHLRLQGDLEAGLYWSFKCWKREGAVKAQHRNSASEDPTFLFAKDGHCNMQVALITSVFSLLEKKRVAIRMCSSKAHSKDRCTHRAHIHIFVDSYLKLPGPEMHGLLFETSRTRNA